MFELFDSLDVGTSDVDMVMSALSVPLWEVGSIVMNDEMGLWCDLSAGENVYASVWQRLVMASGESKRSVKAGV